MHVGDPVAIKFDTFPYTQYGMAHGVVRIISPDSFNSQDEQRNPSGSVPMPPAGASGSRQHLVSLADHAGPDQFA